MFCSVKIRLLFAHLLLLLPLAVAQNSTASKSTCRCIPGDSCWPSHHAWSQLNDTIHGRLIKTTPLAAVCHEPHYDEQACKSLAEAWSLPQTLYPHASEIMSPYWQNQSCDPFTPRSNACHVGNYVEYAVNVASANHVSKALQFAQKHNVRVVIKNTGHDYIGKSTGKGSLGLWTHNMKEMTFLNYSSPEYTGPAVKMGAGVQAFEAYTAAASHGLRVVGGACATVGLSGGFLQGGGHSPLSSMHGMGADQTLEWEVVTATGRHLVASPTQNQDLYWALSGGGGGTYGVVISVTVKAFQDGIVGGASLQINKADTTDEVFWKGVEEFFAWVPEMVDSGSTALFSLSNTSFVVVPLTAPGKSQDEVRDLLEPLVCKMKELDISMTTSVTSFPTYLEHFDHHLGPLPYGLPFVNIVDVSIGGRLIPRSVLQDAASNLAFIEALKLSVQPGGKYQTGGLALNAAHSVAGNDASSNAVLPAWRSSAVQILAFAPWDFKASLGSNLAGNDYLNQVTVPALTAVAPEGGAYLNEANLGQHDWQQVFYGANYDRLRSIKNKYDPRDLFFANTAVGSEAWTPDGQGRLCRSA
ncbi:hypothetical protein CDD81_4299 [Ophiocordyceps australis]|uniref:FAD-binding PCMH-type domain-containing protein n=1 Tax=Ophiocordyceps australis TaxID=1399860 RepID=A0A2C5YAM0_9HYPO|nr:hypothetical protein CDD81_4299 [Ophiocordyceps australis]